MIVSYALAAVACWQPAEPSVERLERALNLPWGVRCQALTYNNADEHPYDMIEAETTAEWGRATHFLNKGSIGYVPIAFELWTPQLATSFPVEAGSGTIERSGKHHRSGGAELMVSPLGLMRVMRDLEAGSIKWGTDPAVLRADFETVTAERRPRRLYWTVSWNPGSEELAVLAGWKVTDRTESRFSVWKALENGARWPMLNEMTYGTAPGAGRKRVTCLSVAILPESTPVPTVTYPPTVVLFEPETGRYLDARLQELPAGEMANAPGSSAGGGTPDAEGRGALRIALWTAAAVTALAAVAAFLRRRSLSRSAPAQRAP